MTLSRDYQTMSVSRLFWYDARAPCTDASATRVLWSPQLSSPPSLESSKNLSHQLQ